MKNLTLVIAMFVCVFSAKAQMDTVRLMFETNKYELTPKHLKEIDSLLAVKSQISRIKIAGHTDNVGSETYNQKLSEKRAASVYKYLSTHGIDTALLFVKYYGETDPRVANTNSENQAKNRRVDIVSAFIDTESIAKPQAPPPPKQIHLTFSNGVKMNFVEGNYNKTVEAGLVASDVSNGGGGASPVTLITNTNEMRSNNMLTMTTGNEPLISNLICCFNRGLCSATKPVEILVPVREPLQCDLGNLILWDQVLDENGRTKWAPSNEKPEMFEMEGRKYFVFKRIPPCGCVNFDFKLMPGCGKVDTFTLEVRKNSKKPKLFTKVTIKKVEVEDATANMLYEAEGNGRGGYTLMVLDAGKETAKFTVRLTDKKNSAYRINAVALSAFQFDKATNTYYVTKKALKAYKK